MRETVDVERVSRFMRAVGAAADHEGDCYFTGGATAVLLGWRDSTIDVDVVLTPEQDAVLRALPRIKNELRVNVELISPGDFIPLPFDWKERRLSIGREGRLSFHHFDLYSQALAKLERGHEQDIADVRAMIAAGLVDADRALGLYGQIEPDLYRFPAIDPRSFRRRVEEVVAGPSDQVADD